MGKKSVRSYLHGQVEGIYHKVGKGIGESRHELKQEGIQSEKIHSDSTRRAYLVRFHSVIEHARNNFGIKSVFQLTDDMVKSWLENERIGKVAASTINVDVAALGKIGQMMTNFSLMNGHDKEFNFTSRFDATREAVQGRISPDSWNGQGRAYERPTELISAIDNEKHRIMAEIQYHGGLRAEGVGAPREGHSKAALSLENFKGVILDPFTQDRQVGVIEVTEKGGKTTKHYVPVEVYERAQSYIKENGPIREKYERYLESVNNAAEQTNQYVPGRGTHGLKHNFVDDFVQRGIECSRSHEEIFSEGARQCAHERADILPKHYLGR
ncbi:MAG: site-specific integrase [Syntrophales bacterium]|nr:site-specific integrase [Syntrophales bacterium]